MFALNNLSKKRITNGRMFVYKQDTTELADVYTYESSEYVDAPNPIYFVDGVPDNTYFFKNNIYDVVVQEYVGDSSDPSGDLRIEMWPESFSTKIGFETEIGSNSNTHLTVHTLEGLRNTNVGENLYVDVIGYWTDNDCERRTYYWDATCVNIADGGLIVDSNVSDTGRWILICNDIMKSEYYGVYGNNHQENIGRLFGYNDQYGSMSLVSPKVIMLAPGYYGDGYTIYQGGGKHIIFCAGAHFVQGTTIRCLSYEGVDTIGAIQIGFNKDNQYSVQYRCNQTARFSNYYNILDFLQSNAQCLIFDVEYNYDNPESNTKCRLRTRKTLTNVRCVFEKPFGFYTVAGDNGEIIFDNCAIESDHKIRKAFGIHFKNMSVSDKWFVEPWDVYPNEDDTGNSYLTNNFEYADSYLAYKLNNCGSAVTADCYGQKLHSHKSIGTVGLSSIELNGLKSNQWGVSMSIPSATFHDCSLVSSYIYSPCVSAFNSEFKWGYYTADGNANNGRVYRHYEGCRFGGVNTHGQGELKTHHNIENATYVNLHVKDCNFENRFNPFVSQNGCALGTNSLTYFYNNVGIGDGYCPTAYWNGANSHPISIINGLLTWSDEVGNQNWGMGKTTYKLSPWASDGQVHRFDGSLGSQYGYEVIGGGATGHYCKLYNDFVRWSDGKVYNFQVQTFSADFHDGSISYTSQLYNPWNQDIGKVVINKNERV